MYRESATFLQYPYNKYYTTMPQCMIRTLTGSPNFTGFLRLPSVSDSFPPFLILLGFHTRRHVRCHYLKQYKRWPFSCYLKAKQILYNYKLKFSILFLRYYVQHLLITYVLHSFYLHSTNGDDTPRSVFYFLPLHRNSAPDGFWHTSER